MSVHLTTKRLKIVPQTRESALAMVENMSPEDRAQVSPEWLALVNGPETHGHWVYGFAVTMRGTDKQVGVGGFKGPPENGVVEIAYAVDAAQRGRGYATEIAGGLTAHALSFPEVSCVRAHTLKTGLASQRALLGNGFKSLGDFIDPADGLVKRFERRRA